MIRTGTLEASQSNRRPLATASGTKYFKSDFILSTPQDAIAPQAFLIEQEPNSVIRAHFHTENQFQVVVAGGATLGRHEVGPISVHYASRHTGYGPITAGPDGVSYFSLRDRVTALAHYLPESRDQMEALPRRNVFAERIAVSDAQTLKSLETADVRPVVAPAPDGLAAWLARVPAGQSVRVPVPEGGADRFHMVVSGTMVLRGAELPRLGTTFVSSDEPAIDIVAGEAGAEVLVLQFPSNSPPASA